jgi:hypothetical protein
MQDERKSVCVLFREVQHIFPPVMRNEPDLRKMLVSSAHFRTADGDDIELFVLSASQQVAFLITSANLDSVNGKEQAEVILRKAFAQGVFNELLLAMTVLKWLKPFILRSADHAAEREVAYLRISLEKQILCGGECTCK